MRFVVWVLVVLSACLACGSGPQGSPAAAVQLSTTVQELREGQVVDGVPCLRDDLPIEHFHVHLQVLLDGKAVTVPAGVGVGRPWGTDSGGFIARGSCFAWIHTHDTTGVVHVFTQVGKSYSLGQVFEVWGQPLGPNAALGYRGSLAVLVDGVTAVGDPRAVTLTNFQSIVLELGRPPATPPPSIYDFGTMRR